MVVFWPGAAKRGLNSRIVLLKFARIAGLHAVFTPHKCVDASKKITESRAQAKSATQLVSAKHAGIEKETKLKAPRRVPRWCLGFKWENKAPEFAPLCLDRLRIHSLVRRHALQRRNRQSCVMSALAPRGGRW